MAEVVKQLPHGDFEGVSAVRLTCRCAITAIPDKCDDDTELSCVSSHTGALGHLVAPSANAVTNDQ